MAVTGRYRSNTSEQPLLGELRLLVAGMDGLALVPIAGSHRSGAGTAIPATVTDMQALLQLEQHVGLTLFGRP